MVATHISGNGNGNGNGHKPAATPSPATVQPAAVPAGYDAATLSHALLEVVSEKTGYPVEMLELESDLEADLGIDSIKRVEILGALRAQFPALPQADPEAFAEVRTLGQIVEYLGRGIQTGAAPEAAPAVQPPAPAAVPAAAAPVSTPSASGLDVEVLTTAFLNVVSEKTGYPVEMLELESDMEADLGIDSIKRVEIMGAMRAQFPSLPQADPEAFAQVRTLGETVNYMIGSAAQASAPVAVVSAPVVEVPAPEASEASEAPAAPATSGLDVELLSRALLEVVSEKTGYPVEMLELESDMEADLGIDSIKRVEIMGALRAQVPNLPQADPEAFAEVRTLGQIIDYMTQAVPSAQPAAVTPVMVFDPSIPRGVVQLKSIPQPDSAAFDLPQGHICLLTDDGTPATSALAAELTQRGMQVAVLSFPPSVVANQAAPAGWCAPGDPRRSQRGAAGRTAGRTFPHRRAGRRSDPLEPARAAG